MAKQTQIPESVLDAMFPLRGVDLSQEFSRQRQGTTPFGHNVRSFDLLLRARGGSRPGLSRLIHDQVSGTHPIQHLAVIVDPTVDALNSDQDEENDGNTGDFIDDPTTSNRFNQGRARRRRVPVGRRVRRGGSGKSPGRNREKNPPDPKISLSIVVGYNGYLDFRPDYQVITIYDTGAYVSYASYEPAAFVTFAYDSHGFPVNDTAVVTAEATVTFWALQVDGVTYLPTAHTVNWSLVARVDMSAAGSIAIAGEFECDAVDGAGSAVQPRLKIDGVGSSSSLAFATTLDATPAGRAVQITKTITLFSNTSRIPDVPFQVTTGSNFVDPKRKTRKPGGVARLKTGKGFTGLGG